MRVGSSQSRTLPMQMSSTRSGENPRRSRVAFRMAYMRYSRLVSLNPPFLPLHSGVRIAKVMTISSGFFVVLESCDRVILTHVFHVFASGTGLLASRDYELTWPSPGY